MDDAELAGRAATGDRTAWAEIYDRYADRLHDYCYSILRDRHESADALHEAFLTASTKIGQLRNPERLRPWLYAICRTQALAMVRHRSRELPSESVADMADLSQPTMPGRERSDYEAEELRRLVWDAAGGLAPRDRSVLDLHLRHGLEGQDLGEALGVNPHHAAVLLSRVREHVERSLGALLVARAGRRDCHELNVLLAGWDGSLTLLLRKRIARHIDSCEQCGERRRRMVSPLALLSGMPLLPAPPELREPVLDGVVLRSSNRPYDRSAGEAVPGSEIGPDPETEQPSGRQWPVAAAGVILALLVMGGLVLAVVRPERPLAGQPNASQSLVTSTRSSTASTPIQSASTAPSTTSTTTTTATTTTSRTVTTARTTTPPNLPPAISNVGTDSRQISFVSGSECDTTEVTARVVDDSPVEVVLVWRTKDGQSNEESMSSRPGNRYAATMGPVSSPDDGPIEWWVVATDSRGGDSQSSPQTMQVTANC